MLAGTAVQAMAQKKQGDADAQVAANNAVVAGYQRNDALQQGAYAAGDIEAAGRRVIGTARAAVGASGVDSNAGSVPNIFTASAINASTDAAKTQSNAARSAWGYTNEVQDSLAKSRMAKQAGYLGALGTGLGGIGSAASAYASSRTPMTAK